MLTEVAKLNSPNSAVVLIGLNLSNSIAKTRESFSIVPSVEPMWMTTIVHSITLLS